MKKSTLRQRLASWILGKPKQQPKAAAMTNHDGLSTTRFYGQRFEGGLPEPTPSLLLDSYKIRQHVRTISHTSLIASALIGRDTDTVIGSGLSIAPEPKYKVIGISPERAKEWITDVKARFELWAMDARSCRSARHNFFQAQRLMRTSLKRDGELFVALSYHNDPALLSSLRFEIIDPDQIRDNGFTWTANGSALFSLNQQGIIRNRDGEEISYRVWHTEPNGVQSETVVPRTGRSGRVMMLHAVTEMAYAGQLRGISPLAPSIQDLENIIDFTEAHIQKAINHSNIAFTAESDSDEPAADPFLNTGIGAMGYGKAARQYGNNPQPDPSSENVTEESLEPVYTEAPHTSVKRPGSVGVFSLPGKQKLKPFPNTSPAAAFNTFVDSYVAYIAAANRASIETVLMRFNANYSASRATLILVWRIAEQARWELDYYVLGPVYEMWLSEEIAAGRVSAPGWADPRLRAAWSSHRYHGTGAPNIDPTKTAAAAKEYLAMGATTLEDVAIEYNDSDAEANRIKLREEIASLREIGPMPWNGSTEKPDGDEGKSEETEEEPNGD
jgi:capsid protein